jgi:MEDS: MEthanogen/methylotroph, DcmR Sensory domain
MFNEQIILNEKNDLDVLEEMMSSNYGEHNILVYPDKSTLREIYSCYCKSSLEYNSNSNSASDELVLLIPSYETVQGVKRTLEKKAGIDVEKYEKDGSLAIIDSFEAYSRQSSNDSTYKMVPLFKLLLKQAEIFGKKGISIISDLGPFYQFQQIGELIEHEASFAQKTNLKCKAFCGYRQDYFDTLTEYQKQNLLSHHFKDLVVSTTS